MQKLKVCRKLMAFVLTLCMVLPLISNQYLVVRAAEAGDTAVTKKLSDLVREGNYVTVDMTQGKDVILTNQKWSSEEYEYTPYREDQPIHESAKNYGTLYQVKMKAQQIVSTELQISSTRYWYTEETIDSACILNGMNVYKSGDAEEIVYVWIPKEDVNGNTIPEKYDISFYVGKKVEECLTNVKEITERESITLDVSSENYIKNLDMGYNNLFEGWIYKSKLSEGYYTVQLADDNSNASFNFYLIDNDNSISRYVGGVSNGKSSDILVSQEGYIFIANQGIEKSASFSFADAKKLSELDIPIMKKGESYDTSSNNTVYEAGNYTNYRLYGITLSAGKEVCVSAKAKYTSGWSSFYAFDNDRRLIAVSDLSNNGSMFLRLKNDEQKENTYYIGFMEGTEQYTVQYEDASKLLDREQEAIPLSEKEPTKQLSDIEKMVVSVKDTSGNDVLQSGVLVKITVPANTAYTFKLENDTAYPYYYIYSDLSNEEKKQSVGTSSTVLKNTENEPKTYYAWIQDMYITKSAAVSISKLNYVSYENVPELNIGDNKISGNISVVACKDYKGESMSLKGYVYKYTVPASGRYALGMKCPVNLESNQVLYVYKADANGNLSQEQMIVTTSKSNPLEAYSQYLKNGQTYYIHVENWYNNQEVDDEKYIDGVTIFVRNDIPNVSEYVAKAENLATGVTKISASDRELMYVNGCISAAKVYKLTLKDDMQVDVETEAGHLEVCEQTESGNDYSYSLDLKYKDTYQLAGTIKNNSGKDKTYYIIASNYTKSITVGTPTNQEPAVAIEQAGIHNLSFDNPVEQKSLRKQRVSYSYYNHISNTLQDVKKEAYFVKIVVPKGKIYTIQTSIPEAQMGYWYLKAIQYDEKKNAYKEYGYGNDSISSGSIVTTMGTFEEGEYYVWLSGDDEVLPLGLSLKEMKRVIDLKSNALEITSQDIQKGSVVIPKLKESYAYMQFDQISIAYGNLVTIKVPANTSYTLSADDSRECSMTIYDIEKDASYQCANDVVLNNTSNKEQTYYVWIVMHNSEATSTKIAI
ncbi:MAG: hypothetical protein SO015_03380, partial [Wujia sp.]